jgi:catechol 2,3-dioxygenase-like lactoylglutathione lyase family enzyme
VEQRVSLITLGVEELDRSKRFYEAMGWVGQTVEETVFFQAGGLVLVLWGRDALADDAGVGTGVGRTGFAGVALAQNVRSPREVDVTRRPRQTSYGGYAGYFSDPDGHLWEVAYNPGFELADDGTLTVPNFSER